jgi:hypothetical protein
MTSRLAVVALAVTVVLPAGGRQPSPGDVVTLQSTRALPPHLAGQFEEPAGYATQPNGTSLVFDRRRHAVFSIDAARTSARRLVDIGYEEGRLLRPSAFDVAADGRFVVADAPGLQPRVSVFEPDGRLLNYFEVQGLSRPRLTFDNIVLNGIASARLVGASLLVSLPEQGSLVTEYSVAGTPVRSFGTLRKTGHEHDPDVHLALNAALALPVPGGDVVVVFLAGEPRFRRYAADGTLLFERVIQARTLDPIVMNLPNQWPVRNVDDQSFPLVSPTIRTAAVDPSGRLWVATITSHVLLFDEAGEKVATYRLIGAGPLVPDSLWFSQDGRLLVTPGLYEFIPPATAGA